MIQDRERFTNAISQFDAANSEDPNSEVVDGEEYPKELLYAQRMTKWLDKIAPEASEALQLAARSQHIRRWDIPRREFLMDRRGYLRWRTSLYKYHAKTAAEILRRVGYDEATIDRVQRLLRKEALKRDPEAQCLEDVACLVFLESYFADFSKRYDEAKIIDIVQKTWKKMSPQGHRAALALALPPEALQLVQKALAG